MTTTEIQNTSPRLVVLNSATQNPPDKGALQGHTVDVILKRPLLDADFVTIKDLKNFIVKQTDLSGKLIFYAIGTIVSIAVTVVFAYRLKQLPSRSLKDFAPLTTASLASLFFLRCFVNISEGCVLDDDLSGHLRKIINDSRTTVDTYTAPAAALQEKNS